MTGHVAAWRRGLRVGTAVIAMAGGAMVTPVRAQEGARDPGFTVERFTSDVRIDTATGGLVVREHVVLRVGQRPVERFDRVIRESHQDGIAALSASVDGARWSDGNGPGRVSISGRNPVRVRLGIAELGPGPHEVTLEYRVLGALAIEGAHATIRWPAIPANRGYAIESAAVRWEGPSGTMFYPATGVAEAGWAVARDGDAFVATRAAVSPRDGGTILAEFAIEAGSLPRPRWQDDEDQARLFTPAFISGGLFILVVAAGILWIVRFQYPSERVRTSDAEPAADPRAPGLALTLARRGRPSPFVILGSVIDLGARGAIGIRSADGRGLHIDVTAAPAAAGHERVVLDALAAAGAEVTRLRMRGALSRVRSRYRRAIMDDLVGEGLADRDRLAAARNLRIAGLVSVVLAAVFAAVVSLTLERYGPWPYAMPVSMAIGGVALAIGGGIFSPLTADGERASAAWRQRVRWMRRLRPADADAEPVEAATRWLPLAAADGYGSRWLDRFRSRLVGVDDGLGWWTARSGQSRADEVRGWIRELESALRPKAH